MDNEVIRERIRTRMKQLGMRQSDLARAIGVTNATISRLMAGIRGTRVATAVALAEALGCSLDYLCDVDVPSHAPEMGVVDIRGEVAYMSVDTWKMFQQFMGEKVRENDA